MRHFLIVTISVILLQSCKKEGINQLAATASGIVRAKGIANGIADSILIGSQGGSLSSTDGVITVSIPPGALAMSSMIKIQPVSSTLPLSLGKSAYRLTPEGQHFLKPVTIQCKYSHEQISGSSANAVFIAYQDESGIWQAIENPVLDAASGTISIESSHFSDWTVFEEYTLRVSNTSISFNQATHLSVIGSFMYRGKVNEYVVGDTALFYENVKNWKLSGQGLLSSSGGHADYTAPSTVPSPNPVTISVEVNNIISNLKSTGKEILFASVYVNNEYMRIQFKKNVYNARTLNANSSSINALGGISVVITGTSLGVGSYAFGNISGTTVLVGIKLDGEPSRPYGVFYFTGCPSPVPLQTTGTVIINHFGAAGDYVEGSFSGTVVNSVNCNNDLQPVSGEFRMKRM